ncbi:MAG: hypothetical protein ACI4U2_02010, partial [Christensenellaceae bacterium]
QRGASDAGQTVAIRTNGGSLTVNASTDDVRHFGMVSSLTVTAVRDTHCYHEFGYVGEFAAFETGKFVAENGASFHQTRVEMDTILNGKSFALDNGEKYEQHYYINGQCVICHEDECDHVWSYSDNGDSGHTKTCEKCELSVNEEHTYTDGQCVCGARDQELKRIQPSETLTMSIGESVNIQFVYGPSVFWSLTAPTAQGAENAYHETISNDSISISNIDVERNTATVTALKAGTNTVHVILTYTESSISSTVFEIAVSGTAQTATVDPTKYDQSLGSPSHLVFGEYSKYASVVADAPNCVMDQAGKGTIRAYSVTNADDETVLYVLSQSSMIFPQQDISSITAKFSTIKTIDLGNLDFSAATGANDFKNMFYNGSSGLTNLTTIYATSAQVVQMHAFDLSNTKMFEECTSLQGGNGTVYSAQVNDGFMGLKGGYAYIDGQGIEATGQKGYFTDRTASPYYVAD